MIRVRTVNWLVIAVVILGTSASADDRMDFFEAKIRPVLIEHCYQCHSADAKNVRGGLLLDSRKGVEAGGESGAVVIPGMPNDSLLLSAMKHESYEMPPDRKLPANVIADFEKWIRDGAVDPRTGGVTVERRTVDVREGREFWSFRPVTRPEIPSTESDWPKTEIDRFVLAEMQDNGLTPVADAAAHEVLRRLSFALSGLPPSPDAVRSFAAEWAVDPDAAVAAAVDELLASENFGERWGRHWLDVTRFAESSGGGRSLMFPEAWRFRDYVIRSFNNDKPFDQLVREHIAGDLLPAETAAQHDDQVTGVGYLTLGPTNYEQQDKELLRMEVVDEQIDTLGRTFLGLTLGCARCHDHKFDPIPTADYYALAGIFRSTKTLLPGNVSSYVTTALRDGFDPSALQTWEAKDKDLKSRLAALKKSLKLTGATDLRGVIPSSLPGIVIDDSKAVFEGEWVASSSVPVYVGQGYQHDAQLKSGRRVRFETQVPKSGAYRVRFAYSPSSNRSSNVPVVVQHAGGTATVAVNQQIRPAVDGLFTELGVFEFMADQKASVSVDAAAAGPGVVIVDAVQFVPADHQSSAPPDQASVEEARRLTQQLQQLEKVAQEHARKKPVRPVAMGVRDEDEPADWHIHVRGGIRQLGPIVPRGFVTVAMPADENGEVPPVRISSGESGRRELAEWVASPTNPLTTRVFVNRVWQHLIGEGLVRTPDNFGKMGQRPTHPELLDYLAFTFVQDDHWSIKRLIRRIAVSRVFRLSSSGNLGADPDNRLLSRGFRRRLEAEALRDAILQISGQLDTEQNGGRTIARLSTYDNGYDHARHSRVLRSVYVPWFRNSMLEFFDVFDVANPNLVAGRRNVSTLPSQGLYLLNSPFVLEQSQLAASHFLATESADSAAADGMLERACLLTLGRRPAPEEAGILLSFVQAPGADPVDAWTAVFQALFASVDFRYLD
ncbi:MAG: DUF1553 domain-containing protein [Fuerstiella sp.]